MVLQSLVRYLKKHSDVSMTASLLSLLFKLGVLGLQIYELIFYLLAFLSSVLTFTNKRKTKYQNRYKAAYEFISKHYLNFLKT